MKSLKRRNELLSVCRQHVLPAGLAVVPEPYIPYVPTEWNGLLVLAEAQNLSGTRNSSYRRSLIAMSPRERMERLGRIEDIGIQPWDDGSLKLAVEATFGEAADRTSVSNAVLWSQVDEKDRNKKPSRELIKRSVEVWADFLAVLNPAHVVTAGIVARDIIYSVMPKRDVPHTALPHSSPLVMSRVSGKYDEADLRRRYPEVDAVIHRRPGWADKYRQNTVVFACHAVSLVRDEGGLF